MLLARLSSWLELKLVSLPFSFLKRDPRLLGTVLLEEQVETPGFLEPCSRRRWRLMAMRAGTMEVSYHTVIHHHSAGMAHLKPKLRLGNVCG